MFLQFIIYMQISLIDTETATSIVKYKNLFIDFKM